MAMGKSGSAVLSSLGLAGKFWIKSDGSLPGISLNPEPCTTFIKYQILKITMDSNPESMPLEYIREQYQEHWVLVDVTEEDEQHQPTAGLVMAHSDRREELYEILESTPASDPLILFTGDTPKHVILKD